MEINEVETEKVVEKSNKTETVLWKNNKIDQTLARLTKTEKDKGSKWIK